MVPNLGYAALLLTFILALYSAAAAAFGQRRNRPDLVESARNASLMAWPLISLAALLLIGLLVRGDYQVDYVASASRRAKPTYWKITALWGGQAGSLLFWCWLM